MHGVTSVDPPSPGRTAHVRMLFARLVEDIRRIERDYPVWDCGLADICEAALPDPDADAGEPTSEPASSTASATLESQLAVLRVTRQLGLVPGHEYRRQRRDIMCRIRARRLGHAPVLAQVI